MAEFVVKTETWITDEKGVSALRKSGDPVRLGHDQAQYLVLAGTLEPKKESDQPAKADAKPSGKADVVHEKDPIVSAAKGK